MIEKRPDESGELTDPSSQDDSLADLAADLADRMAQGESIDLDAVIRTVPGREAEVRELYATIRGMVRLGGATDAPCPVGEESGLPDEFRGTFGDFRLIREAGRGGMGVVYEAEQLPLGRQVALKILPHSRAQEPKRHERFLLEARAASQLQHRNIVALYTVGTEAGTPFLVMQFVDGPTLAQVIDAYRGETASPARFSALLGRSNTADGYIRAVAEIGREAADALEHAHERGIVHRDIKPANLMLDAGGHVLITDFGLAQIQGDSPLTQTGDMLGTLRYMSPEQARGRRGSVDARTDLYSLAATLYELLTLSPVFDARDRGELMRSILEVEPPSPRSRNPAISRDLDTILAKALSKSPEHRYATARDMADDLDRFLRHLPIKARPIGRGERLARWGRRNRRTLIPASLSAGAVVVALVGFLIVYNSWLRTLNTDLVAARERAEVLLDEVKIQRGLADERRHIAESHLYDIRIRQADEALRLKRYEQAQEILLDCLTEDPSDDPREFAWHYLWRQASREVRVLTPREEDVQAIALSYDNQVLASVGRDNVLRLRSVSDRRLLQSVRLRGGRPSSVAFSRDDQRVLVGLDYSKVERAPAQVIFYLWDRRSAGIVAELPRGSDDMGDRAEFLPDGRHLLTIHWNIEEGGRYLLWEIAPKTPGDPLKLIRKSEPLNSWQVSADGRRLASIDANRRRVAVVDLLTNGVLFQRRTEGPGFSGLGLSRDGSRMVALWPGPSQGKMDLGLWDVDKGLPLWSRSGIAGGIWIDPPLFLPDDRGVLVVEGDAAIQYFDLAGQSLWRESETPGQPHECSGNATLLPQSDRFLIQDYGARMPLRLRDRSTGKVVATFPGQLGEIDGIWPSRDGSTAYLLSGHRAVEWNLRPAADPTLAGHTDEAWALAFSPDGRYLYSGSDDTDEPQTLKVWEVATGHPVRGWKPHNALVTAIAVQPGGEFIATAGLQDKERVKLWDPQGRLVLTFDHPDDRIRALAFSPDGKTLAAAGQMRTIRLFDVTTGRLVENLEGHTDAIRGLAFRPDGRALASVSSDRTVRVWPLDGDRQPRIAHGGEQVMAVAFAPQGRQLAWCDIAGVVHRWDLDLERKPVPIQDEPTRYFTLAYSPDGRTIAVAGLSGRILLHDARTGQFLMALSGPSAQINRVAFSPDGHHLAATWHDGSVRLFRTGGYDAPPPTAPSEFASTQ